MEIKLNIRLHKEYNNLLTALETLRKTKPNHSISDVAIESNIDELVILRMVKEILSENSTIAYITHPRDHVAKVKATVHTHKFLEEGGFTPIFEKEESKKKWDNRKSWINILLALAAIISTACIGYFRLEKFKTEVRNQEGTMTKSIKEIQDTKLPLQEKRYYQHDSILKSLLSKYDTLK